MRDLKNVEIGEPFCGTRFSKGLSFASFARTGNDQLLLELEVSAIKPKQNEGNERLAGTEGFADFSLKYQMGANPPSDIASGRITEVRS